MVQTVTSSKIAQTTKNEASVEILYGVAMPNPHQHLFEVTIQIDHWSETLLDLKMPVWTPGS